MQTFSRSPLTKFWQLATSQLIHPRTDTYNCAALQVIPFLVLYVSMCNCVCSLTSIQASEVYVRISLWFAEFIAVQFRV